MSNPKTDPFATGAAEAAKLVQEVQNLGFEAARTIVERFGEIFAQFAAGNGGAGASCQAQSQGNGGGQPALGFSGSTRSAPRLPSDMQRAADSYVAIMGQLNEAGLRFLDATRWWQPPETDQGALRLPDVAPGGRVSARLWLHNTTASEAVDLRPWCPGLASHTGASLPAGAVTCTPQRIDRLDPDASRVILVTVDVGEDAVPGGYHGQLLVDGLPDVVFPLRIVVVPTTNSS
jgi:hypothetical protein